MAVNCLCEDKVMKRIGLLTMHRVINFGSILQAYATQLVVEKFGYDCTIIDYQYPNKIHPQDRVNLITRVGRFILQLKNGCPYYKQKKEFARFQRNNLKLSRHYSSKRDLQENFDSYYDAVIVGSDQTWNVRHIGEDDSFLLPFVSDDVKKISYASSAARKTLPQKYEKTFKKMLSRFFAISVRENNTRILVNNLIGVDAPVTLDPTLLVSKDEWMSVADKSRIKKKIKGPFILAYILKYSFDPYPLATDVIRKVYKKYKMPVVCIRYSVKEKLGIPGTLQLNEAISPEDFLWLFANASFVISSSFHGTAFSVNFERPFYSIVNHEIDDDRIMSLLNSLGLMNRAVSKLDELGEITEIDYEPISKALSSLKEGSITFLKENL